MSFVSELLKARKDHLLKDFPEKGSRIRFKIDPDRIFLLLEDPSSASFNGRTYVFGIVLDEKDGRIFEMDWLHDDVLTVSQ